MPLRRGNHRVNSPLFKRDDNRHNGMMYSLHAGRAVFTIEPQAAEHRATGGAGKVRSAYVTAFSGMF